MIQAVLFDMDGTLLDSERLSVVAWQKAAARLGYELSYDFTVSFHGTTIEMVRQIVTEGMGADVPFEEVLADAHRISAEYFPLIRLRSSRAPESFLPGCVSGEFPARSLPPPPLPGLSSF